MQRPVPAPESGPVAHPLQLGPEGLVEVAPDFAAQADERFESVCDELGILLARRVEPVSARVLPFGSEQVAMVQLLDTSTPGRPRLLAATGHGLSRAAAVADAAIDAMTGGRSVLASALPGAVAEGKVRTAVVFGDGEAPVRWGRSGDEARLAALYAVVPHLGSFSATTGTDTYRVLRLPGIGVALVSEGASAATWVEGWFAALLHATQFAFTTPASTDLVAQPSADHEGAADAADDVFESPALVLEQLEDECRRILTAAQEQAREIREAAERDASRARTTAARSEARDAASVRGEARGAVPIEDDEDRRVVADARREADAMLGDAERARAALLAEARREIEAMRHAAEATTADLLADARKQCEGLVKQARRQAKTMRREAKSMRREAKKLRRGAARASDDRRAAAVVPPEERAADVLGEARRTTDNLLHDARRSADDLLRDAAHLRQRLLDDAERRTDDYGIDVRAVTTPAPATPAPATPAPETSAAHAAPGGAATTEAERLASLALLSAASETLAAMSSLLGRASAERGAVAPGDPFKDLPGLYFGA